MSYNFQQFFKQNIQPLNSQAVKINNEQKSMLSQENQHHQGIRLLNRNNLNQIPNIISPKNAKIDVMQNRGHENKTQKLQNLSYISDNQNSSLSMFYVPQSQSQQKGRYNIITPSKINQSPYNSHQNVSQVGKQTQINENQLNQNGQVYERSRTGSIISILPNQQDVSFSQQQNGIQKNSTQIIKPQVFQQQPKIIKQQQLPNNSLILPAPIISYKQQINSSAMHSRQPSTNSVVLPTTFGIKVYSNQQQNAQSQEIQQHNSLIGSTSQLTNILNQSIQIANLDQRQSTPLQQQLSNEKQILEYSGIKLIDPNSSDQKCEKDDNQSNKDELIKLKNEISFLSDKLRLKEEEVSIFQSYVLERREIEKENQNLLKQLEEANVQTQYLQLQQSKNNSNGTYDKETLQLKEKIFLQQEEMVVLNKELQNSYKQLQYQETQLHNADKANQELKKQLEEKNETIMRQKEIIALNDQLNSSPSRQLNRNQKENEQTILELEQQNQIQTLKIESLERNLVLLETENRKIKKQQSQNQTTESDQVDNK